MNSFKSYVVKSVNKKFRAESCLEIPQDFCLNVKLYRKLRLYLFTRFTRMIIWDWTVNFSQMKIMNMTGVSMKKMMTQVLETNVCQLHHQKADQYVLVFIGLWWWHGEQNNYSSFFVIKQSWQYWHERFTRGKQKIFIKKSKSTIVKLIIPQLALDKLASAWNGRGPRFNPH